MLSFHLWKTDIKLWKNPDDLGKTCGNSVELVGKTWKNDKFCKRKNKLAIWESSCMKESAIDELIASDLVA